MLKIDTIAAIATAVTASGIGIIRISGENAIKIADAIFFSKSGKMLRDQSSHTIHYGWIRDDQQVIDEVLVLLMKAPNSYTSEDTVEIDCHGGVLIMKKIMELVIKNGARTAEPGEFTKRAFLNGRMDLSQAEAVIDIINAKNESALESSLKQLSGRVAKEITAIRKDILYHVAFIESALDDPEHVSLDGYREILRTDIDKIIDKIRVLIESSDRGRMISEGIRTAIIGRPNVGKSSLMNLLLGEERAIVTDIAGTTRDTLEEHLYLKGISLNVVDTAGIHETDSVVERIGIARARQAAAEADLIIYVMDSSDVYQEADQIIFNSIRDKKVILLFNKIDLPKKLDRSLVTRQLDAPMIDFSAKDGIGIEILEECIKEMFYKGELHINDQVYITNIRHKSLLESAYGSLQMVKGSICSGMSEDFYSIDLMDCYTDLGSIIGESVEEDVVNEIFSKFCTGK